MKKIYLFPKYDPEQVNFPNPYVDNLEIALSQHYEVINKHFTYVGIIDIIKHKHLFTADIFFFNWVENLPNLRYGRIQSILFILSVFFIKLRRKKIIWVLHNKYSHETTRKKWTRFGFKLMVKKSDFILTHSEEGVSFIKQEFPKSLAKVKYFIHPVEKPFAYTEPRKTEYDLFLWGAIYPYKGILEFLEYAKTSEELKDAKILIAGKCPDKDYLEKLQKYFGSNVEHHDKHYEMEDIAKLSFRSRFTLFTYNSDSILSSGSLMDSIRMGAQIIGPDKGAFHDLISYNFMQNYNDYSDIARIFKNSNDLDPDQYSKELEKFNSDNSWEAFGDKFHIAFENYIN